MRNKILIIILLTLSVIHMTSADIIIPKVTNIYFEKNGAAFNESIDFTILCYGYSWNPGPAQEKEPGTYKPIKVESYSGKYSTYGEKIYEPFYGKYRHIDYCNLEFEMQGKKYILENFSDSILTKCEDVDSEDEFETDDEGNPIEQRCEMRFDISDSKIKQVTSDNKGFFASIGCFFKRLFGKSC